MIAAPYLLAETSSSAAASSVFTDLMSDTWAATDALGRALPMGGQAGGRLAPQPGKSVGIFYFLWLGSHGYGGGDPMRPDQGVVIKKQKEYKSPFDITKLLAANPSAPQWGPSGSFHHWGESALGYYLADDEFVIRKHAQMLADAGVDVLFFDTTNALTYAGVYMKICQIYRALRESGYRTPQIAFLLHSKEEQTAQRIYDEFYSKNLYPELWFRWKGKPLMLAAKDKLNPKVAEFFTIRESWAWTKGQKWFGDGKDKWPWLDNYPQTPGWHDSPGKPEQISVAVAQHPISNIGRSYHDRAEPTPDKQRPTEGLYFAEQWKRALEVDPEFIFITGWNEWVAQRFVVKGKTGMKLAGRPLNDGDTYFVDTYSQELSRDIEPMKGGYGDNYYYQMVANIRRFKGARPLPTASRPKTIAIDGDFSAWDDVQPEYRDMAGDTFHRNHPGWGRIQSYTDDSGRNDFVRLKVARDQTNLYFYAETRQPITSFRDPNWMLLFIDADQNSKTGCAGYNLRINKRPQDAKITTIEKSTLGADGKYGWIAAGTAPYHVSGNKMELAIPISLLGAGGKSSDCRFDFHWADGVDPSEEQDTFTRSADNAPDGRFNYRYQAK
ncbi:MAG: hypothetical protein NTX50_28350 [Candidatus Sumerlaeota bacterium]|nr:hypothetical protein [Candidatus Sumerlaeota bacterium]